jgi:hypothetical protein
MAASRRHSISMCLATGWKSIFELQRSEDMRHTELYMSNADRSMKLGST